MVTQTRSFIALAFVLCVVALTGCTHPGREGGNGSWQPLQWIGGPVSIETAEREVSEQEVPTAALAALRQEAGGHAIEAFEEETRDGRIFYEGEWETPAGEQEATVSADGVVIERERSVSEAQAPTPVLEALRGQAGDVEAEYSQRMFIFYEVEYEENGEEKEMLLTPLGQHIGTEVSREQ